MLGALILLILMIPVIVWSPIGRALAQRLQNELPRNDLDALEQRLRQVERFSLQQHQEIEHLQTQVKFYEQLAQAPIGLEASGLQNPELAKPIQDLKELS